MSTKNDGVGDSPQNDRFNVNRKETSHSTGLASNSSSAVSILLSHSNLQDFLNGNSEKKIALIPDMDRCIEVWNKAVSSAKKEVVLAARFGVPESLISLVEAFNRGVTIALIDGSCETVNIESNYEKLVRSIMVSKSIDFVTKLALKTLFKSPRFKMLVTNDLLYGFSIIDGTTCFLEIPDMVNRDDFKSCFVDYENPRLAKTLLAYCDILKEKARPAILPL